MLHFKFELAKLNMYLKRYTLIVLFCLCLFGCGDKAKIDRLHVTLNEDLSGTIAIVIVESVKTYDELKSDKMIPDLEILKEDSSKCGLMPKDYRLRKDHYGFTITKKFEAAGELRDIISCMHIGKYIDMQTPAIRDNFFEREYISRIKIGSEYFPEEIILTMPGEMKYLQISSKN